MKKDWTGSEVQVPNWDDHFNGISQEFHVDWWRCLQVSEKLLYMIVRVESQYVSVRVKGKASRSREPLMTRTVEKKEAYVRCWQLR